MAFSPQRLLQQLQTLLAGCPSPVKTNSTLWLAYSGGLDSHVLLHAMQLLRVELQAWQLHAVHINHGLHADAASWAEHTEQVCRELSVPCTTINVDVDINGEGVEAAARYARYQAFAGLMQEGDILITAQHADDQAETFLLQVMRGSGPRGMSAMPAVKAFANGLHIRPMLGFQRAELEDYAQQMELDVIHDPSNKDTGFDRNFLRHDVMPVLQQRWPAMVDTLCRDASQQAEAATLLDVLAEQDLQACAGEPADCLDLTSLSRLDENRQRNLLRYWLRQQGLTVPHRRKLNEVLRSMLSAADDRQPCVDWKGGEVRRYRGQLYASPAELPAIDWQAGWNLQQPLLLPAGLGSLSLQENTDSGLDFAALQSGSVRVAFRQGGENCQPAGRQHHHSLKKLFQEAAIPPWQRERTPLVYVDGELAQVLGVCVSESFKAREGRPAVDIVWHQEQPNR